MKKATTILEAANAISEIDHVLSERKPQKNYYDDGREVYTFKNIETGVISENDEPYTNDHNNVLIYEPSLYEKIKKTADDIDYINRNT